MKYYEKLVEIGGFSREELVGITGSLAAAKSIIYDYQKKGYIERVRHNLYVTISLETHQPILSRYQIGSRIFPDACISHHSAFEVYGYANQVFYEMYVATASRFADFDYDGVSYHRVAPKYEGQVEVFGGIKVTSLERTVVDSVNEVGKIAGLEELVWCISLMPTLNEDKLLDVLKHYRCGVLYQKCGYLLEGMNGTLGLSKKFFEECSKNISKSKRYFMSERESLVWHGKWNLYAPASIQSLVSKGVGDYDAI